MGEDSGKGAPQTRVGMRIIGQAIRADHGQRVRQYLAHILFTHVVVDRSRRLQPLGRLQQ